METEDAFVVCHVNVTAWPEVTLLPLAAKVRVGVAFDDEPEEPDPQPVIAISIETTTIPNSARRRVMNGPLLPNERSKT